MTAILGTEKGREEKNLQSGRKEGRQTRGQRSEEDESDNANCRPTNDVLAASFFRLPARPRPTESTCEIGCAGIPTASQKSTGEPERAGNRRLGTAPLIYPLPVGIPFRRGGWKTSRNLGEELH